MRRRKTVEVKWVKDRVNAWILNSSDRLKSDRHAMGIFLSEILHRTNNYNGFSYLNKKQMQTSDYGFSVGINEENDFSDTDNSRVQYI